jgi:hypothetical protein
MTSSSSSNASANPITPPAVILAFLSDVRLGCEPMSAPRVLEFGEDDTDAVSVLVPATPFVTVVEKDMEEVFEKEFEVEVGFLGGPAASTVIGPK